MPVNDIAAPAAGGQSRKNTGHRVTFVLAKMCTNSVDVPGFQTQFVEDWVMKYPRKKKDNS